jgi:hypothetical protein
VDTQGDLPTTCTSDFLISVTSTDGQGNLHPDAGYGVLNVDLATYGQNIFTTKSPDEYGTVTGTSYATPQVTGAIALLYSARCAGFAALYKSDPKAAALLVRQFILQGVTPKGSLANFVATGGRLNLYNSLQRLTAACTNCFAPTSLNITNITDKTAILNWIKNAQITRVDLRWRAVGAATWTEILNVNSPYNLTNLQACTNYEFQLRAICGTETQEYSKSTTFKTDGCCVAPSKPQISFIGGTIGIIRWSRVLAASSYSVRFRVKGTTTWQTNSTTELSLTVNSLTACTEYELQLASICNGTTTDFSSSTFFRTPNCGACRDLEYCIPKNLDASKEWIASVKLATMHNVSGSNEGYGDYTGMVPLKLTLGSAYEVELKPGFSGLPNTEYFIIWIDLNQDGIFTDAEAVFRRGSSAPTVFGTVTIPNNAKLGITRMRVAMQFLNPGGPCTFVTNNAQKGAEVEDYCVEIVNRVSSVNRLKESDLQVQIAPNPFSEQLNIQLNVAEKQTKTVVEIINVFGQIVERRTLGTLLQGKQTITLDSKTWASGLYFIQFKNEAGQTLVKKMVKQ